LKGLFVTGTDTGVGKTFTCRALIAAFRRRGLRVGVFKPCETGCEEKNGALVPSDASLLLGDSGSDLTLDRVCPYRFRAPMAPAEAAEMECGDLDFEGAVQVFREIRDQHDVTLVEGAGGLLVPFQGSRTVADLAGAMGIPVLVVARIGLGTINHTCLTVEYAKSRDLDILGIVFNRCDDPISSPVGPDEARNPDAVARLSGAHVLGNIPYIQSGDPKEAIPHLHKSLAGLL